MLRGRWDEKGDWLRSAAEVPVPFFVGGACLDWGGITSDRIKEGTGTCSGFALRLEPVPFFMLGAVALFMLGAVI